MAGYVHSGVFAYWDLTQTMLWEFLGHLQDSAISGLPGFVDYNNQGYNQNPLRRLTDQVKRDANGAKACPSTWTRPAGRTCDKYPFRSTWQGASTGGGTGRTFAGCDVPLPTGVTGPSGYSSCFIDGTQNSAGGSQLNSFYYDQRVLEMDPFLLGV